MTARDRIEQMYAEHVGDDALARQRQERVERHPCCGERTTDGHHVACSKRPTDEAPAHIDGQVGLL